MSGDQLQPEDTLDDRGVDDVLDEGYSPPERETDHLRHPEGGRVAGGPVSTRRSRRSGRRSTPRQTPTSSTATSVVRSAESAPAG